jgi:hypothetical protein
MLGFATVDLSMRDDSLTVWLTSEGMDIPVAHSNANCFELASDAASRRAWSMACDRYVILTDRTPRDHPVLNHWGAAPCDLAMLAKQTTAAQERLMAAFAEHAAKRGKADLMEPFLPPVPGPLDQTAWETCPPEKLTLAVANQVKIIWTAWLAVERERVKRWSYMPGGTKGEALGLLPAEFVEESVVQPVRSWVQ